MTRNHGDLLFPQAICDNPDGNRDTAEICHTLKVRAPYMFKTGHLGCRSQTPRLIAPQYRGVFRAVEYARLPLRDVTRKGTV